MSSALRLFALFLFLILPGGSFAQAPISLIDTYSQANVWNFQFQPIQREWVLSGLNSQAGFVFPTRPENGNRYEQSNAPIQSAALLVVPPSGNGDFVRIRYPLSALQKTSKGWTFSARLGIQKQPNNISDGVTLSVGVSGGGPIDSGEIGSYQSNGAFGRFETLKTVTVLPGQAPVDFWATLGLWPYKANNYLELIISKGSASQHNWNDLLLIEKPSLVPEEDKPALAFAYANMVWLKRSDQVSGTGIIRGWDYYLGLLKASGAKTIRLEMREASLASNLADIIQRATELGLSTYLSILQDPEDYDSPRAREYFSPSLAAVCGYAYNYPLSKINIQRFSNRLNTYLSVLRARNLKPLAIEIGNEFDFACFNTDAVDAKRHVASVQQYAQMLKAAHTAVRNDAFFKPMLVLSGGMANPAAIGLSAALFIPKSTFLATLSNVGGQNFAQMYADGIGEHLYPPDPSRIAEFVNNTLEVTRTLVPGKPIYVTEFGFAQNNCKLLDSRLWGTSCTTPPPQYYREQAIFKTIDELVKRPWLRVRLITIFTLALGTREKPDPLSIWDARTSQFFPDVAVFRAYDQAPAGTCRISLPSCPLHPSFAGNFEDNASGSREVGAKCFSRAKEYSDWCNTPVNSSVLALYSFGGLTSWYNYLRNP